MSEGSRKVAVILPTINNLPQLVGVKGNPKMTNERPVDFMGTMLQTDVGLILAAQKAGVKRFLYTSSIAVDHPEDDKYPACAKQTAETLIEAMRVQYPNRGTLSGLFGKTNETEYCIVRPANVYGRYDNFDNPNAMVITSLIKTALSKKMIEIWGDGSQTRDFINAKDVARGMIKAMEEMPERPVNLCSGREVSIKQIVELISEETGANIKQVSTSGEHFGSRRRVMDINWDFRPEIGIADGIKEVIGYVRRKP